MTSQQFSIGALISLIITVFTVISTIYPAIVTTDKNNNNINREILKLRNNLSLKQEDVPFTNFDDYENISDKINKSDKKNDKNMQIFMSILAYREGKILEQYNEGKASNDSMEYYLTRYINNSQTKLNDINHTNIIWYPLRQLKLEDESKFLDIFNQHNKFEYSFTFKEFFDKDFNRKIIEFELLAAFNQTKSTTKIIMVNNQHNKFEQLVNKIKEEDFCDDLDKNSDTIPTYCSKDEIKKIISYSKDYPYVINIMNDNLNNKLTNLTYEFRQISDYFKWFIVFSFISGPFIFFLWIRNYIE